MVVGFAALLVAWGGWVLVHLPVDVFPDLNKPTVSILTEAPGLAPEDVEVIVSTPIELALSGAPGITRVRSVSGVSLSIVFAEFDWTTDVFQARQLVSERLQLARERLPETLTPAMSPVSSLMGEILLVGLQSEGGRTSPMDLRTLADVTLRRRLLAIPGVSQVTPIGGQVKQVQVLLDPLKLQAASVTLGDVERAVALAQGNTTGGFLDSRGRELLVRNVARTANVEDIAATAVTENAGVPVTLADLGTVVVGARAARGDAGLNAAPAVVVAVSKQPGASTLELTRNIERELESVRRSLPPDVELTVIFRQASFISAAIGNVKAALRDGAILVVLVLFLFLMNLRTTLITLTAIPVSIVVAGLVFHAFDLSINTMTLGGLAIAIGELVDDAIVDVENVLRRLSQNRLAAVPRPVLRVIYEASSEVRSSIVYATVLVVLVFLPLFALSGMEGRLFAPLGLAYIVSILASLVVSLTLTPALCALLLPRAKALDRKQHGSRFVQWLQARDRELLRLTLPHSGMVIAGTAVLVVAAAAAVPFLGREFLPPFNEGTATVNIVGTPGISLTESDKLGAVAEKLLLTVPEVRTTGRRTGRAEMDEHAEGVHYSEIDVDFSSSARSREEILNDVRGKLTQLPGVFTSVGQPISHRLDHVLSGVRAQVAIKIFGPDLDTLRAKAEEVRRVVVGVRGAVDVGVEAQVLIPQLVVRPRRDAVARLGLAPGALAGALETALGGRVVGEVLDGQAVHELVVRYQEGERNTIEALRATLVDIPGGRRAPLGDVADVIETTGPNQINHENGQRRIVVSSNVSGRDLVGTVKEMREKVGAIAFPSADYAVEFGGQFESQRTASRRIALLSLVSLAAMFMVLYTHFGSVPIVLQVLVNIPLALVGAVVGVALTGGTFSIASLVGFITLTGIASRNTIMMISHYIHLVKHEGERIDEAMVVRGSVERLVPVLMTALTAGLSLVPLALAAGEPGKEILHPVAVVILGGLVSSTLLDVVVTPAVFWRFGRKSLERLTQAHAPDGLPERPTHHLVTE